MSKTGGPLSEREALSSQRASRWQWAGEIVLTAVVSATTSCLFILVVVLLFGLKESGSAADWLATLFNGVVAISAVAAFMVARSWLPQLTTQEGYKLAIELVNDHYIWLGPQNDLLKGAGLTFTHIRSLKDGDSRAVSKDSNFLIKSGLKLGLLAHKTRRDTMENIRTRLGTYGLENATPVHARFQTLDRAYRDACDAMASFEPILGEVDKILSKYPGYEPCSGKDIWKTVDNEILIQFENAEIIYGTLQNKYSEMLLTYSEIFSTRPNIGKLFKVRK